MTDGSPTTVLVADDEPDLRALVRAILGMHTDFEVVSEAVDGLEACDKWMAVRPDVVVLDERMPRLNGLQAAARIRAQDPRQPILLFTAYLSDEARSDSKKLGIGCLDKRDASDLPGALRKLVR